MALKEILAWMEGDDNTEFFYCEDEERLVDGKAMLSAAGSFVFTVNTETWAVDCRDKRPVVQSWLAEVRAAGGQSVAAVLGAATKAYQAVRDKLEEAEEEDDFDDDDEVSADDGIIATTPTPNQQSAEMVEKQHQFEEMMRTLKTDQGSQTATDRILSDYRSIFLSKTKSGWDATPIAGNLYRWQVRLFGFEPGSQLAKDFAQMKKKRGLDYIDMLLTFPEDYPFSPPFLRIVRPRFQFQTGRVTIGGSICHELLTKKGWKPVNDIESVIETVRAEITDPESKATLDLERTDEYTERDAHVAFQRTVEKYGWN